MKKIFIFFLLCIPLVGKAQHTLKSELNLPRVDDQLIKEQVTFCQIEEIGENLIWDFSKLRWTDDYPVQYFSRHDFGTIGAENGSLYFYQLSGDSLLLQGYENPNNLVRYQKSGLLLKFPLEYGVSSESSFQGRGKHNDRLESIISGDIFTSVDAFGSLILPGKDTLENVVRVHIHKNERAYYSPISYGFDINRPLEEGIFEDTLQTQNPDLIITDTYQWYGEGYRYPVFETIESYRKINENLFTLRQESYFYHPADQTYSLPEDTANIAVLEKN
jgi:hypothetical protein